MPEPLAWQILDVALIVKFSAGVEGSTLTVALAPERVEYSKFVMSSVIVTSTSESSLKPAETVSRNMFSPLNVRSNSSPIGAAAPSSGRPQLAAQSSFTANLN